MKPKQTPPPTAMTMNQSVFSVVFRHPHFVTTWRKQYAKKSKPIHAIIFIGCLVLIKKVPQMGIEPTTYKLAVCCSIQLSYWGTLIIWLKRRNFREKLEKSA
jgi:hypothetical protein